MKQPSANKKTDPKKKGEDKPKLYNLPNTPENLTKRYSSTMRANSVGEKYPKGEKRDAALKKDSTEVSRSIQLSKNRR